ncbi:MAG: hypothetical protein IPK55_11140 [Streptococcus sp.]|nr:hypothetical protein [Streptococcus sp.]
MEKLVVSSDYDFNHLEFKELMLAYFYEVAFSMKIKTFPANIEQFRPLFFGLSTFFSGIIGNIHEVIFTITMNSKALCISN